MTHPAIANIPSANLAKGQWWGKTWNGLDGMPLHRRKPTLYAIKPDFFFPGMDMKVVDRLFTIMAFASQHIFVMRTRRPDCLRDFLKRRCASDWEGYFGMSSYLDEATGIVHQFWPLKNLCLGVKVTNQAEADALIPALLETPAAKRFVFVMPTGPVSLDYIYPASSREPSKTCGIPWGHKISALHGTVSTGPGGPTAGRCEYGRLSWVICGGETGPKARPMHPDWARSLRDQCRTAGVPFFFKQWGEWAPSENFPSDKKFKRWKEFLQGVDEPLPLAITGAQYDANARKYGEKIAFGPFTLMAWAGRRHSGRQLDGTTHDAFPEVA